MSEESKKKTYERVQVYLRLRPSNEDDLKSSIKDSIIDQIDTLRNTIIVRKENEKKSFSFDFIFDHTATQKEIFCKVGKPVVGSVLEGYNGTIFAYGQTGTGKTHTMIGNTGKLKGIIPRCMKTIFKAAVLSENNCYSVKAGFLQLYMD